MPRHLDYYYSLVSPWAYLGHATFMDIARRHDLAVRHKPVALGPVFAETGGLPLPKRHPVRQRYRMVELQRWRDKRGLRFHLQPRHWPFEVALADRFVVAVTRAGADPDPFLRRAFAAVWESERDLADAETIAALAREAGLDPGPLLAAARDPETEAAYGRHHAEALAADVFGSPSYVLDGEVFWGQDRLELLDDALTSGRPAYRLQA